jgi:N4-gp56 family major capsid protein
VATNTTSTSNFNKFVNTLIRAQLEELLRAPLPHIAPAVPAAYVKGTNGTMRFLNIPDLSVTTGTPSAGTPPWLTEGTAPTDEALTLGYEEFTAHQAGRTLAISDLAEMESPTSLVDAAVERLARNVVATSDKYLSDIILAGANVIYSDATATQVNNSSDDLLAADVIQARDIRRAVALMRALNIPTFGDGTYHAIIHPFVSADLMAETATGGWLDVGKYSAPEGLLSGEIGKFAGVRFAESSVAAVKVDAGASSTVDVYSTTFFGPGPWALGDFGTVKGYVTLPGGQTDPLHQKTKAGWKSFQGGMLIGEGDNASNVSANKRYLRLESSSSLGTNV